MGAAKSIRSRWPWQARGTTDAPVIELDTLSPDATAIILLCTSLGEEKGAAGERPVGPVGYSRLAEALRRQSFQGPRDLLGLTAADITRSLDIDLDVAGSYVRRLARAGQLAFELDRLRSRGVWVVTIADEPYPGVLRERLGSGAPPVLFGSGPPELLIAGGISIVGSREADTEATSFTEGLASAAARGGATVISGGARGIDAVAMRAALQAGGSVIGVVPEGVERRLREASTRSAVAERQAVLVSPYHPAAAFSAGAAMGRNKLIYALADVAVVVSSAEGTGGTWTGALEAIEGRWVPLMVREAPNALPGNAALISRGATALRPADVGPSITVDELLQLAGPVDRVAEATAEYGQQRFFE
jgi:predicted Rossmann fold nucleotide-binding protein DprA/Smf involved in DNA uptake